MLHYWIDWLTKSGRNGRIWRRKKSFFMMTIHHLTHRTLHRHFCRVWQIVLFGRHRKVERSLDSLYRTKRRVHWEIKPMFAKKINFYLFYHVNVKHTSTLRNISPMQLEYGSNLFHSANSGLFDYDNVVELNKYLNWFNHILLH